MGGSILYNFFIVVSLLTKRGLECHVLGKVSILVFSGSFFRLLRKSWHGSLRDVSAGCMDKPTTGIGPSSTMGTTRVVGAETVFVSVWNYAVCVL